MQKTLEDIVEDMEIVIDSADVCKKSFEDMLEDIEIVNISLDVWHF